MKNNNVVELLEYKERNKKIKYEHTCLNFIDGLKDRIEMLKVFEKSFKQYIECMVRDGNLKKSFANNLNQQVDLIIMTAADDICRRKSK